ncbi:MAG TPA: hypothetical protein VLJ38_21755, partial [Polyangiaceae bacterium]|nr:hypothetical protein [Polyangiaceae bacterium]
QVAASGAWLVFCRQSGVPHPELVVGAGAPEAIDDLLAWDSSGRFLVLRRGNAVWLLDVENNLSTNLSELGFDDRDDVLDYRQHRALAFDPRGEMLAYVRRRERVELVLRTLATGEEQVVAGTSGEPWRFAWDANGRTLVVSSVAPDPVSGRTTFPVRLRRGPRLACSGILPHFHVNPDSGERPATTLVSRDGLTLQPAPDFAAPFGDGYVGRGADGALVLVGAKSRQTLADADCGGRVLFADPERGLLLVTCNNDKLRPKRVGVELVGVRYRQELGAVVQSLALDRWPALPVRLVPLYPGSDVLLVDLDTRKTVPLTPGDRVLATSGEFALVRRDKALVWFDTVHGTDVRLASAIPPFAGLAVQGTMVAVGSLVVDARAGRVLGSVPGRPLALTWDGAALVAEGGAASATAFARGPLRWHTPTP